MEKEIADTAGASNVETPAPTTRERALDIVITQTD
jgi:hypothetical protein